MRRRSSRPFLTEQHCPITPPPLDFLGMVENVENLSQSGCKSIICFISQRLLARGQHAPCGAEVDRGGVHLLNCVRCAQVTKAHDLVQGWVRRQARGAGFTVTVTGNPGFPAEMDPAGGVHRRPDIALQHDAFSQIPGVWVPFYWVGRQGLALDVSLVSSASVDDPRSPPRPRPDALRRRHAEKMGKHGLWCSHQGWGFAPLVVSTAGVPHADSLRFLELLSS